MDRQQRKRALLIGGGVLLLAALVYAFLPDPIPVETATATRGPLRVTVEEEGETRLADRYTVSAPVAAVVRRIDLEPGDPVQAGQVVARLEAAPLDPRARSEADARVRAAEAALEEAEVAAQAARAEAARTERLHDGGAATRRDLERATAEQARALSALERAQAEFTAARAARQGSGAGMPPEVLRAPTAGRVLAVHHESEGAVNPGEPLLEIGDTRRLEITADVLSQDAVRIRPGAPVLIDEWGGDRTLEGVATRVEPEGYTRVSALGVEERRVPVRAAITSPPAQWDALGSGYRALVTFVVWQDDDVLQVPTAALFRTETGWAVFVRDGGRARLTEVRVGQQAALRSQVLSGLEPGQEVVVHPPNELEDGARVDIQ